MQCAYCGATLKPGAKECSQCGAEVAPARPPGAPGASAAEDAIPEAFPYADPSQAVEAPLTTPEPEAVTPAPPSFADIPLAAVNPAPADNLSMLAIASLVLGVFSLCTSFFALCGAPVSIVGLILGAISLKSSRRGIAVSGIVLNGAGLLLAVIFTILIGVMGFFSSRSGN
jgi:hypothetical protein